MPNTMSENVKNGLITTARITGKVILRLIYIFVAVAASIALALGSVYYIGVHYYENYYKDYMTVQQGWSELDEEYVTYINILKDNESLLDTHIASAEFKKANSAELEYINSKLAVLKTDLPAADYSMAYKDKFATYPAILSSANELVYYLDNSENEDIKTLTSSLKETQSLIDSKKTTYNELAKEFNIINKQFPEKYFSEIASFEDWPAFQ